MMKQLTISLSLLAAFSMASIANAAFLPAFTGNSQTIENDFGVTISTADGLINFTVYENDGTTGDWIVDLGLVALSPIINTVGVATGLEEFVYFYQLVNTNPVGTLAADSDLSRLLVEAGLFSAGGFIPLAGFDDAGAFGPTGPPANPAIGTATDDTIPGNHDPGVDGELLDSPEIIANPGAFAPIQLDTTPANVGLGTQTFYRFLFPNLDTGMFSTVVFLTSDREPVYLRGRAIDGGNYTDGDVPSNTPELGTFAMALSALVGGVVVVMFRRWGV